MISYKNKRIRKRKIDLRRGAAAVEFALVMPVFVLIIVGAMELCYLNVCKSVVINKAREAARLAINTNADAAAISSNTIARVADLLNTSTQDIVCDINAIGPDGSQRKSFNSAQKGDLVEVTITMPYSKISLFSSNFMSNNLKVSDSCIMLKE